MSAGKEAICPNFMGPGEWGQKGICRTLLEQALENPGDPRLSQVVCTPPNQADYASHELPNLTRGRDNLPDSGVIDHTKAIMSHCPLVGQNFAQLRREVGLISTNRLSSPFPYPSQEE